MRSFASDVCIVILLVSPGCGAASGNAANSGGARVIKLERRGEIVQELVLGELGLSRSMEAPLRFVNQTVEAIRISKLETSCDCVALKDALGIVVEPGQTLQSRILVDLNSQPEFVGDLNAEITGLDESGNRLFQMSVLVTVSAGSAAQVSTSAPDPSPMPEASGSSAGVD